MVVGVNEAEAGGGRGEQARLSLVLCNSRRGEIQGSYPLEIMELKAFEGFSRLFHRRIHGYFSDTKHKN